MDIYLVGGAVRDALMGLPVQDHDWVVVGATPEQLLERGFMPVGRDFPVFLHPQTREEYALARTERNTAGGYRGFAVHASPTVTLEEDLARRDLTINSIAVHAVSTGEVAAFDLNGLAPAQNGVDRARVVDPYGGQRDLAAKLLRHVTPAFREDPVRILRVARFAARFTDFTVAPETLELMRDMVATGEVDHLVPERVWQELSRGLMEKQPSRMFAVLRDCGALAHLLPDLERLWGVPQRADHHPEIDTGVHVMMVLDMAAQLGAGLPVRFACLTHDLGKGTTPLDLLPRHIGHEERSVRLIKKWAGKWGSGKWGSDSNSLSQKLESDPQFFPLRVPNDCLELAEVVAREHGNIHRSLSLGADAVLRLLERCDAIRKPERFDQVLLACECDARGRLGMQDAPYPQRQRLKTALAAALGVATHLIAIRAQSTGATGPEIGKHVRQARLAAVTAVLAPG